MKQSEKHKVVRIIARLNVGGPAQHAAHLSSGLSDEYDTLLVTGSIGADEADLSDLARAQGVRIEVIPKLGREISLANDLVVLASLYRLLRRVRPVIVHTHTAKAGTVGRIAAYLAGVPIRIHTFHGHVLRGYFGPLKTRVFTWIERALAGISTRIIAISPIQAADLQQLLRLPARKVATVPLGLDLDRFDPAKLVDLREGFRSEIGADARPVIACVGRLVPIKNHDLLLRAFALLTKSRPDSLLVIVGGGSELERLRALAERLGIQQSVHFLGWRSDLERIYAGTDVVVLSSDNEGTPVCLIEALSAGVPVVATDVGGVRDVLDQGRLGSIVPPGDAGALAAALEYLLANQAQHAAFAAAGPREIPARFSRDRLIWDIRALYATLIKELGH